LGET
jgi:hypothetical protein